MNNVDKQYLDLLRDIIENGVHKDTRSGPVRSVFGRTMRFSLKDGLPLLTTKKVYTRGIIIELLWFLKGDTNIKYLVENNTHIWDDDAYRYYKNLCEKHFSKMLEYGGCMSKEEFLEDVINENSLILPDNTKYTFGDLGPIYGKQWRDWNGHDQINDLIWKLKNTPDDRRLIISAWNVGDIDDMALPPCHYSSQFYTRKLTLDERIDIAERNGYKIEEDISLLNDLDIPQRELSCMFNMRSCDVGLGWSFNVASYSILTHTLCEICNMEPGEVIFNGGDVHVYENHVQPAREQLKRYGYDELPTIRFKRKLTDINDISYDDIIIEGYKSDTAIKYPLSVGQ